MDIVVVTGSRASEFVLEQAGPADLILDVARLQSALGGSTAARALATEARNEALKRLNMAPGVEHVWVTIAENEDALTVQRRLGKRVTMIVVDGAEKRERA